MLSYDPQHDIWRCSSVWMSNATFKRYVAVWLEGIKEPTSEQVEAAVEHCRRVGYWQRYGDPDVHFAFL